MCHDECTHEACTYAPAGCPRIFRFVLLVEELHVESLSEVLSQEMAGAALQSFSVLHHGLYGVGIQSSGKALGLALHTLYHGHGHVLLCKGGIHLQHLLGALLSFLPCGMGSMSFLPQEFAGAQKQSCAHLPPHHVTPLVDQYGQVTVGVDPVFECVPYDGLRGGADDEFFFQLGSRVYHHSVVSFICLQTIVCDHSTFLGETFHMFSLLG